MSAARRGRCRVRGKRSRAAVRGMLARAHARTARFRPDACCVACAAGCSDPAVSATCEIPQAPTCPDPAPSYAVGGQPDLPDVLRALPRSRRRRVQQAARPAGPRSSSRYGADAAAGLLFLRDAAARGAAVDGSRGARRAARLAGMHGPEQLTRRARRRLRLAALGNVDEERGVAVRRVLGRVVAVLVEVEADGPVAGRVELDRADAVLAARRFGRGGRRRGGVSVGRGRSRRGRRRRSRASCRRASSASPSKVTLRVGADRRRGPLHVVLAVVVVALGVEQRLAVVDWSARRRRARARPRRRALTPSGTRRRPWR